MPGIDPNEPVHKKSPNYQESYADAVAVNCNLWDFVITFGIADFQQGQQPTIENYHKLRISPQTAKALIPILMEQVRGYEEKFGTIPKPPDVVALGTAAVN